MDWKGNQASLYYWFSRLLHSVVYSAKEHNAIRPVIPVWQKNISLYQALDRNPEVGPLDHQAVRMDDQQWYEIRNTYLHILMTKSARIFLRLHIDWQTFQFICLHFGLSSFPRGFMKLLRSLVRMLQLEGIKAHVYLDNWPILADSPQLVAQCTEFVMWILWYLGWPINVNGWHSIRIDS